MLRVSLNFRRVDRLIAASQKKYFEKKPFPSVPGTEKILAMPGVKVEVKNERNLLQRGWLKHRDSVWL